MLILLLIFKLVSANGAMDPLWVGIVRTDGMLVPIAIHNQNTWTNNWPSPSMDEQPEVEKLVTAKNGKMQLQDIPNLWRGAIGAMPVKWYLWANDAPLMSLKAIDAQQYWSHCSAGWALKTNLQSAKEDAEAPTPKLGIATSGKSNVVPFVLLSERSPDAPLVVQAVKAKFKEKEEVHSSKEHEIAAIRILRIYRTSREVDGRSIYFIEAQRQFPGPDTAQDANCYDLHSLNAWAVLQKKTVTVLHAQFIASDCHGRERNDIVPDVVISVQGKPYVVSESYGNEQESYAISEVLNGEIREVLKVGGGGC
jgi:hypothetical protein